ncbi:hypothetical protein F511_43380 [Dorcoceras hygrometricum]|uniref:Uncharacterized protein n=1 Tax=Dorcoceras hygrometricum TaxID=472368 RepID=A0A2Z7BER4_9LAMI|nr:hypothetical protein F511_43380 [Dorcoceras hygrometricum]
MAATATIACGTRPRAAVTCAAQPRNAMRDKRIFVRRHFDHRATSAHGQRATAGHRWRNGLRTTAAIGRATCATIARPARNEMMGNSPRETQGPAKEPQWFDLPYDDLIARWDAERPVVQFSEEEPEDVEMREDNQVDELIDADEKMSLEDILMTIPVDVQLPSAGIEITKITMGREIKISGVDERTRYLACLPQIPVDNKGKAILMEKYPVKGNPAKEHYYLICADIDLLVHLRAQVIDSVDQFFHSFSVKKLATINIEELSKKEEQVLCWGETETTHVALNRKRYILLKYREVLVRKLLESWKKTFVPGGGSSATDLKVIDMLSDLHLFVWKNCGRRD